MGLSSGTQDLSCIVQDLSCIIQDLSSGRVGPAVVPWGSRCSPVLSPPFPLHTLQQSRDASPSHSGTFLQASILTIWLTPLCSSRFRLGVISSKKLFLAFISSTSPYLPPSSWSPCTLSITSLSTLSLQALSFPAPSAGQCALI